MTGAGAGRKPTFLWQAVLILLPVAVLSAVGWSLVRQDKVLARHDAVERAQAIAQELLPRIWTELTSTDEPGHFQRHSFETDDAGQLIFPPAYSLLPIPDPFDVKGLTSEQARLWRTIQSAGSSGQEAETLIQSARDFIATKPPEKFAAVAQYDLGLLLLRQGRSLEAARKFDEFLEQYPDAVGESGLPLRPLVQFRLLYISGQVSESATDMSVLTKKALTGTSRQNVLQDLDLSLAALKHVFSLESFCSNIVDRPTLLTPFFLDDLAQTVKGSAPTAYVDPRGPLSPARAELLRKQRADEAVALRKWQDLWEQHETSRQLFSTARPLFHTRSGLPPPRLFALPDQAGANPEDQEQRFGPVLAEGESNASNAIAPRLLWFNTPMPLDGGGEDSSSNAVIEKKWYRMFPGDVPDWKWLAVRFDENQTSHWFVCHSESELGARLGQIVKDTKAVPEFLGVGLEVAGRKVYAFAPNLHTWHMVRVAGKEGSLYKGYDEKTASEILSTASRVDSGVETLKVSIYLTSPATLYQHQVARAFWFGALVLVSTIAALTGLFAAWRGFKRQELLVEMKSNFVSSVSHELRAPIASVRLMAESLERGKIPDALRQNEYFRFIVQECRRLSSLIENVLDFSRIEQGRKQYEFEPTDLAALTRETVRLMEPYAAEKGVALKLETSNIEHRTSNIELEVDGRAIQQALVNLIDNAIKHSPKGETVVVELEVSGARCQVSGESPDPVPADLTPDTSHLALSVTDHGPGIPPEEHEKIFERFYRLGSELRRETQGVGIGLSIVQHIIAAHGGRVRVESEVGKGSRFTIELPVKNNHE